MQLKQQTSDHNNIPLLGVIIIGNKPAPLLDYKRKCLIGVLLFQLKVMWGDCGANYQILITVWSYAKDTKNWSCTRKLNNLMCSKCDIVCFKLANRYIVIYRSYPWPVFQVETIKQTRCLPVCNLMIYKSCLSYLLCTVYGSVSCQWIPGRTA